MTILQGTPDLPADLADEVRVNELKRAQDFKGIIHLSHEGAQALLIIDRRAARAGGRWCWRP